MSMFGMLKADTHSQLLASSVKILSASASRKRLWNKPLEDFHMYSMVIVEITVKFK